MNVPRTLSRTLAAASLSFLVASGCTDAAVAPVAPPAMGRTARDAGIVSTTIETIGGSSLWARAINDAGAIAGDQLGGNAFRWTPTDGLRDLGSLGGYHSAAIGINNAGAVVGRAHTSTDPDLNRTHAFLWTPEGGMRDLGTLGGSVSTAVDVNDDGMVMGLSTTPATSGYHAFVWTGDGGMRDLGWMGTGELKMITNAGAVIGDVSQTSGFIWTEATGRVFLPTFGGARVIPMDVTEGNTVVGYSHTPSGEARAFRWTAATGIESLGTLGGGFSAAHGINESGQVAGSSERADGSIRAFIWTAAEGMRELPSPGYTFAQATGITESGAVFGAVGTADGFQHAVLWSPDGTLTDLYEQSGLERAFYFNNALQVVWGNVRYSFSIYAGPAFEFSGFLAPVAGRDESGQYALNRARAGSAIPVKFQLGGAYGLEVLASGYPASSAIPCDAGATVTQGTETVTAGSSRLSYDEATGTYTYVWKTDASWTGCRQLVLQFVDGSMHRASFRFDR